MEREKFYTTKEIAETYDNMTPLLSAMYLEFKELSKKKPDAALSKRKIQIVNRLIEKIRVILSTEENIAYLDVLDEDDVPQTSDVVLILSQYVAAMKAFHEKHYGWDGANHKWFIG
ncbi:hypothetical protein EDF81_3069 [Enterobacter sp. BIGb0383]|uniref:hypothetical protein n=1 Tax=unclassified Enterobacter TaxID=2608935 RepID=UPI000F4A3B39|nr:MULTISPECIES: hypothetical protein [unclassified Enterobacter]ROP60225.1 hypothetical protein EDF81_3069 [Enterobacter sp. BIGb0383]ROS08308.1 hypothetical protein EC848_1767 [Enterobacter sp. BIGb0359]